MKTFQFNMLDLVFLPIALLPSFVAINLNFPNRFIIAPFFFQLLSFAWGLYLSRHEKLYIQRAIWLVVLAWLALLPAFVFQNTFTVDALKQFFRIH